MGQKRGCDALLGAVEKRKVALDCFAQSWAFTAPSKEIKGCTHSKLLPHSHSVGIRNIWHFKWLKRSFGMLSRLALKAQKVFA